MEKFDPSSITVDFSKEDICLGIDEAGRGPVLGPMVYACAYWPEKYSEDIKKHFKFNDSKQLSAEKREKMFEDIKTHSNLMKYKIIVISPEEISFKMYKREKVSLNDISHDAAYNLIKSALDENVNITSVYIDTIGPPEKYEHSISRRINNDKIKVTVRSKADKLFTCVSAASIAAKVTRDKALEEWEFQEKNIHIDNMKCSGYPSDDKTVEWLNKNYNSVFGFPSFVRLSWSTVEKMFKDRKNDCEWENYVTEEEKQAHKKEDKNQMKLKMDKNKDEENKVNHFYEFNKMNFDVEL